MKAVIEIDVDTPQAKQLLKFIETLPFAKVKKEKATTQSVWDAAIAEGAVSVEEFFGEVRRQVKEHYDNA